MSSMSPSSTPTESSSKAGALSTASCIHASAIKADSGTPAVRDRSRGRDPDG